MRLGGSVVLTELFLFAQESFRQRMSRGSGLPPVQQETSGDDPLGFALVLAGVGIFLFVLSIVDLNRGKAVVKYGPDINGLQAKILSLMRLVGGAIMILWASYLMLT